MHADEICVVCYEPFPDTSCHECGALLHLDCSCSEGEGICPDCYGLLTQQDRDTEALAVRATE